MRAIETLRDLRDAGDDARPTDKQLAQLAAFSGWGGCAVVFDDFSGEAPQWALDLGRSLREALPSDEDWDSARLSTRTAFFTPPALTHAMWTALVHAGLPDPGHAAGILEPGCGTGNLMRDAPSWARVEGVELDASNAAIARWLNPRHHVVVGELQAMDLADGSFDAAIGNVPYDGQVTAPYRLLGETRDRALSLHDYFMERAVDSLRPGGVTMLLTSRHAMDRRGSAVRLDLARKAELAAVVRLPDGTFARRADGAPESAAATMAGADLLVFRKRPAPIDADEAAALPWVHSHEHDSGVGGPVPVNDMLWGDGGALTVGTPGFTVGAHGAQLAVTGGPDPETDEFGDEVLRRLDSQLARFGRLSDSMGPRAHEPVVRPLPPSDPTPWSYDVAADGSVWMSQGPSGESTQVAEPGSDRAGMLRAYLGLSSLLDELRTAELDPDRGDEDVEGLRGRLRESYNAFADRWGRLGDLFASRRIDRRETHASPVQALEVWEDGEFRGTAACLEHRTFRPIPATPDHVDDPHDALAIALNEPGSMKGDGLVPMQRIMQLTGLDETEVGARLHDKLVADPDGKGWRLAEDYLAGTDVKGRHEHVRGLLTAERARLAELTAPPLPRPTALGPEEGYQEPGEWGDLHAAMDSELRLTAETDANMTTITDPLHAREYARPTESNRPDPGMPHYPAWFHTHALPLLLPGFLKAFPDAIPQADTRDQPWDSWPGIRPEDRTAWPQTGSPFIDKTLDDASVARRRGGPKTDWDVDGESGAWAALLDPGMTGGLTEAQRRAVTVRALMVRRVAHAASIATGVPMGDTSALADALDADPQARAWVACLPLADASGYSSRPELDIPDHDDPDADRRLTAQWDAWRHGREEESARMAVDNAEEIAVSRARIAALEDTEARLSAALPADIPPEGVGINLSSPWIPPFYIHRFLCDTLGIDNETTMGRFRVARLPDSRIAIQTPGNWNKNATARDKVEHYTVRNSDGLAGLGPFQLVEDACNNTQVTITRKVTEADPLHPGQTRAVPKEDATATHFAYQRLDELNAEFDAWCRKDPVRLATLTRLYNETANRSAPYHADGSYLRLPGMASDVTLRPHQKDAVAQVLRSREGTLIAHCVGAGKTFEGIAAMHEAKRLGRASKPLVAAPNAVVGQWADAWRRLYPQDRVLVLDDSYQGAEGTRLFWSRVAAEDWDGVIVGHSAFDRMPLSAGELESFARRRADDIEKQLKAATIAAGDTKSVTVKKLAAAGRTARTAIDRLTSKSREHAETAGALTWDKLGCDMLFVDEAHNYKNLSHAGGSGVTGPDAGKCESMLAKVQWMRDRGLGRNIVFATGTPLSNAMAELYTMAEYVAPGAFAATGADTFLAWQGLFEEQSTSTELDMTGQSRSVRRTGRFKNLTELCTAFQTFATVITEDDIDLDLPDVQTVNETVPAAPSQKAAMASLVRRAKAIHAREVEPDEDNMLKLTTDAKKVSIDPKLLDPTDPGIAPLDDGKVARCADNVARIWRETDGAQLVFCDMSTPGRAGWNVYRDLKARLVARGVPAGQVQFIHDHDSDEERKALSAQVDQGKVRVVLGSTQKLGTGVNIQGRLVATHDLDCPWRPSDLSQRLGRMVRQGNAFKNVTNYRYVTKGTADAWLWQTVLRKRTFISQVVTNRSPQREASALDETVLSYSATVAAAQDNPLAARLFDRRNSLGTLQLDKSKWLEEKASVRKQAEQLEWERRLAKPFADRVTRDADALKAAHALHTATATWEGIDIQGVHYDDRGAAQLAIIRAARQVPAGATRTVGSYDGLSVTLTRLAASHETELGVAAPGHEDDPYPLVGHHVEDLQAPAPGVPMPAVSTVTAHLSALIKDLAERADSAPRELEDLGNRIAALTEPYEGGYPRQSEIDALAREVADLERTIRGQTEDAAGPAEDSGAESGDPVPAPAPDGPADDGPADDEPAEDDGDAPDEDAGPGADGAPRDTSEAKEDEELRKMQEELTRQLIVRAGPDGPELGAM